MKCIALGDPMDMRSEGKERLKNRISALISILIKYMLCSESGIRRKRLGVGGSNEFDIENFPFGYLSMS